jgi:hypothetical protein
MVSKQLLVSLLQRLDKSDCAELKKANKVDVCPPC